MDALETETLEDIEYTMDCLLLHVLPRKTNYPRDILKHVRCLGVLNPFLRIIFCKPFSTFTFSVVFIVSLVSVGLWRTVIIGTVVAVGG